jgi:hypothetical protein
MVVFVVIAARTISQGDGIPLGCLQVTVIPASTCSGLEAKDVRDITGDTPWLAVDLDDVERVDAIKASGWKLKVVRTLGIGVAGEAFELVRCSYRDFHCRDSCHLI